MPKPQKVGPTTLSREGGYDHLTDRELAECIRSQGPAGHGAETALKQRHAPYAAVCARLCTRGRTAADRLTHEALEQTVEAARSGVDPSGTWRDFVLTHVHDAARSWARGSRRALLRPAFLAWADAPGGGGAAPAESGEKQALRNGFFALPEPARGVLWYSLVDQEPDERVAAYVGVAPVAVPALRAKAQQALRDAFLQAHAERAGDTRCNGFRRLIEAAAVTDKNPRGGDLALHLDSCLACESLLTQLILLSDDFRTALAHGLLIRDGAAYTSAVARERHTSGSEAPWDRGEKAEAGPAEHEGTAGRVTSSRRPPRRRTRVVAAAAAAVAVSVPLLLIAGQLAGEGTRADQGRAGDRPPTSAAPSKPPTGTAQPVPGADSTPPPGAYGRIVHASSGLCLDVENGVVSKRGGAVAARCTEAITQRWALDALGRLHNLDDSTFCLKADGDGAGVGLRPCSSDNPEKLDKMAFIVGPSGAIRPKSAPTAALIPDPEWVDSPVPLVLRTVDAKRDQDWTVESFASAKPSASTGGR
ncbi:ricin-type beta-trefoil lectin domain protein [Streptomyces sp. NPDC059176]|uniref:ricin-type beta-trefoil lectin domain protein n=1 Tax=unclassified Streptomyces TaxID=2593676 RepID=UPI0036D10BE6